MNISILRQEIEIYCDPYPTCLIMYINFLTEIE